MLYNLISTFVGLYYGEVPKLAEGTPLERVQVVNSGARVQIPPSPFPKGTARMRRQVISLHCGLITDLAYKNKKRG